MKNNTVITIGRQFGSGGREIGKKIAETLDIPFYDRELISLAAEKSGYNEEMLEGVDEKPVNLLFQSFAVTAYASTSRVSLPTEITINDRLFLAQSEVIREAANQGSCVIVGRCADYILRNREECVNFFIHANLDVRIQRVARLFSLEEKEAKNIIHKTDKKRASYYNYYTNQVWDRAVIYDLCVNSATLGVDGTVEILCNYAKKKDREISPGI